MKRCYLKSFLQLLAAMWMISSPLLVRASDSSSVEQVNVNTVAEVQAAIDQFESTNKTELVLNVSSLSLAEVIKKDIFPRKMSSEVEYSTANMTDHRYCTRRLFQTGKTIRITYDILQNQQTAVNYYVENTAEVLRKNTVYQTIKTIHDHLCNNVAYDKDAQQDGQRYDAYNAIVQGKAVCEGYAILFQKYMEYYGIPSYIVANHTHAWNVVCIDGEWYHIDCTWDDQEKYISRSYFLVGKQELQGTKAYQYQNSDNIVLADSKYIP